MYDKIPMNPLEYILLGYSICDLPVSKCKTQHGPWISFIPNCLRLAIHPDPFVILLLNITHWTFYAI